MKNLIKLSLICAAILITAPTINANSLHFTMDKKSVKAVTSVYDYVKYRPYNNERVYEFISIVETLDNYEIYKDKDMISFYKYIYIHNDSKTLQSKLLKSIQDPKLKIDQRNVQAVELLNKRYEKLYKVVEDDKKKKMDKVKADFVKVLAAYDKQEFTDPVQRDGMIYKQKTKEIDLSKKLDEKKISLQKLKEKDLSMIGAVKDKKESDFLTKYTIAVFEKPTYENILIAYKSGNKELEQKLLDKLSEQNIDRPNFIPTDLQEVSYMIRYFIITEDIKKAKEIFDIVNKSRLERSTSFMEKQNIAETDPALFQIYTYGAYLYKDDFKKQDLYRSYVNVLTNKEKMFLDYTFAQLDDKLGNYEDASNYLYAVQKADNFKGLNGIVFRLEEKSAMHFYENNQFDLAWVHAKNGVQAGYTEDYKTYYKDVVNLKKIMKSSADRYMEDLKKKGKRDLIMKVNKETGDALRLVQK